MFFVLTLTLAVLIGKKNASGATLIATVPAPAPVVEPPKPTSIAEEAEKAGEKPLEPEAVTPPAEMPAKPDEAPAPDATEPAKPADEPAKPAEDGADEQKPAEQTPPPADEEKAPAGQ